MESLLCQYCKALSLAFSSRYLNISGSYINVFDRLQTIYKQLITTVHILYSEAYCCFIDLIQIAFYSFGNRLTNNRLGPKISPIKRSVIVN